MQPIFNSILGERQKMGLFQIVKKDGKHLSYLEPKNLRNRSINDKVMAKSHFLLQFIYADSCQKNYPKQKHSNYERGNMFGREVVFPFS